jgi:hypothetical protein
MFAGASSSAAARTARGKHESYDPRGGARASLAPARPLAKRRPCAILADEDSMSFQWYHRIGIDPWQMGACETHGAELVALGFRIGVNPQRAADATGVANQCALCNGSTSIAEVRRCRCNTLGTPCPVHGPKPAGVAGEWSRVRCIKCGAQLQLPADRIAFEPTQFGDGLVAVDVTHWANRNGDGNELRCPFHGSLRYSLEHVSGPGAENEDRDAELDDDSSVSEPDPDDDEPLH